MIKLSKEKFNYKLLQNHKNSDIPLDVEWAVTQRCNLNCIHCYISGCRSDNELSFQKSIEIIDELFDMGCLHISFTGGDPFIRADFMDIYIYAKKKGFLVSILTNGTKITDKIVRILEEYPPVNLEITVNGIKQEVYEDITRISGSFFLCMEGVDLCLKYKLPLTIKCNGMKVNKNQILDIKRWVKNLDGKVRYRFDPVLLSSFDSLKDINLLRLAPKDIIEIENSDDQMKKQIMECGGDDLTQNDDYLFNCTSRDNNLFIDFKGDVSVCTFIKMPKYNLSSASLKERYEALKDFRKIKYSKDTKCKSCPILSFCRQCPGRAFLEHNDMEKPVDYFCKLANKHYENNRIQKI